MYGLNGVEWERNKNAAEEREGKVSGLSKNDPGCEKLAK